MKRVFFKISVALLAAVGISSCTDDYLDKEVDLTLSADNIFSKYDNTKGFLAHVYEFLPDAFHGYTDGQYLAASKDCMTDNAISFWNVHRYHSVQSDTYDATNHYFSEYYWPLDLQGIRAANQYMENAREDVVGNATKSGDDNHLYDRWMAEARFLRAILHFDLICWFGPTPIIDHVLNNEEAASMTRTAAAEALLWVANECDSIINSGALPFRYTDENSNWGRVNGAAVYALKSRALLYRASPLNNTSGDTSWWTAAANAALAFISANNASSNPYKLYTSSGPSSNYYDCFVSTPHLNDEYILSRSEWTTYDIELYLAPCGFSGSANSVGRTNPTENLVSAYETINGLPIDQDPTYDAQNPYANRDPRLDQTILHYGSYWGAQNTDEYRMIDTSYPDGTDYQELHGGTTTSYYTKKFLNNMSFKEPTTYVHACPIFRYAEILLNAAEALNEAGQTSQAYTYVNQVRDRVGMPAYSGMTQSELRERLQNERRVELAFEDHRFFDVRRWKLFEGTTYTNETSKPYYQQVINLYSTQVTVDDSGAPTYTVIKNSMRDHLGISTPKSYYFPIPNEVYKQAPSLGQNSGWEVSDTSDSSSDDSSDDE